MLPGDRQAGSMAASFERLVGEHARDGGMIILFAQMTEYDMSGAGVKILRQIIGSHGV